MRILFATTPADGHFNPLTAVALDLQSAGHDVRWYVGPRYEQRLAALGIAPVRYDRATEVTGENIHELYPERAKLKGPKLISFDGERLFIANVENHYRDIVDIRSRFAFDLFVCDAAFYAQKLIADKLAVPVYSFVPGPLMAAPGLPPPFFGLRPARTVVGRLVHRGVRAMVHSTLKQALQTYNTLLAVEGIETVPISDFLDFTLGCATRVFLIAAPCLDFPQLRVPPNADFVGPLLPAQRAVEEGAGLPDMVQDPKATVVAVSQGTVDNADPSKLIIPTLEALADQPLVVVVTTGGRNTDELRERFPQPNIVIEDFVRYDELFEHSDVFVTNGGAGSVLSAISRGVPLVTAGKTEAKNDINARVAYNGLGVDLRTEHPTPRQLSAAVLRVLADRKIADNVERARRELDSYRPLEIIRRCIEADAAARNAGRDTGDSAQAVHHDLRRQS